MTSARGPYRARPFDYLCSQFIPKLLRHNHQTIGVARPWGSSEAYLSPEPICARHEDIPTSVSQHRLFDPRDQILPAAQQERLSIFPKRSWHTSWNAWRSSFVSTWFAYTFAASPGSFGARRHVQAADAALTHHDKDAPPSG
jgi:hypothetical protein